jgi:hypothetical protein
MKYYNRNCVFSGFRRGLVFKDLQGSSGLDVEDGTDSLSQNAGNKLPICAP